jgi:predicted esterase
MRGAFCILSLLLLVLAGLSARADEPTWPGEWRTSLGVATFKPEGDALVATFGNSGLSPAKGEVKGRTAQLELRDGTARGQATLTLDDSGRSFSGWFQFGGGPRRPWNGWRPDPEAANGEPARLDGLWLTTLGLMELGQDGNKADGRYALRGTSKIEGEITGRHLEFRYHWFRDGKGWFDLSRDGRKLEGAALGDGSNGWYGWRGRRAPEYRRHVPLQPGRIVDGSTRGLLTYSIRAPEGFKDGDPRRWPAVVVLHGSNMNGRAYVATLAAAWPELARDHLILGLNGETPSDIGEDPRFNYTYVNFVGRSTYRGFPGTDRESPALVAEALTELKAAYPIARYFVGGHSQGGFLTYSLLMNSPDLLAGAFPISCGVIFQCEPEAYADEALRRAQRSVPLAIVHGRTDPVVDFGLGRYAANLFGEAGWPAFHFFTSETAGHNFQHLPVDGAIRWLESLASDDPDALLAFAEKQAEAGRYRDAIAALRRTRSLKLSDPRKQRADRLGAAVEAKARAGADEFLPKVRANADASWIDGFLAYRDEFECAEAARAVMEAFAALRKQHEPAARRAFGEAQAAFQQGKPDQAYAKYQEIVDKAYASSLYRNVREWLKSRPSR